MKKDRRRCVVGNDRARHPQKAAAAHFGVSEAAISKRLRRLRQIAARPAVLDRLTEKEQKFVVAIVEGRTQTDAAEAAFDVTTRDSAKAIGNRLMKDADIKEAITAVMESEGLSRRHLVKKLKVHVDGADPQVSLKAVDMGLKLHDAYPAAKTMNLNVNLDVCPVDLSRYARH
ncbi:terminase small subunit [Geobacter sp.]|uniref:terminase small subunit n=1 Tax=Geobacter sp. TaxID=46610 RepID=UPI002628D456|nr:terminase small subunit [Geobacter sp.]